MMGQECLDNLILGSYNAQLQPSQQAAGALLDNDIADEERGSIGERVRIVSGAAKGSKRTKVPIYG